LTPGYPLVSSAPIQFSRAEDIMAKSKQTLIKMVSTADTGFFYVTNKNPKKTTEKLTLKKYDPVARKHVAFKESKIK
jgi:large subunit ribosomal protein L33